MRVALFTENFLPKVDGIVTVLCLLLDHLAAQGVETVVIAPNMGVENYNRTAVIGVPGLPLPQYPELKVGPPTFNTYKRLKAFEPDVIHLVNPGLIGASGMLMAKRLGVPVLASFHLDLLRIAAYFKLGFIAPFLRWYTRKIFSAADYVIAPSRAMQQHLLTLGVEDVGLWRRGVDADRFHPRFYSAQMRATLSDGHPEDCILLYVGRLSVEKQLDQLKSVLKQIPDARLALVGDGPARRDLEATFSATRTRFMGYLQGEALAQAYASSDIFVFPSAFEAFGLVVLEAMAAGLPVVAARVGGVPDVIVAGQSGCTFASGDVAALVAGVQRLARDNDLRALMARAARAFAEQQAWPPMMDEVLAHYRRLAAQQHVRAHSDLLAGR